MKLFSFAWKSFEMPISSTFTPVSVIKHILENKIVSYLIFTDHLWKWLCYDAAELQFKHTLTEIEIYRVAIDGTQYLSDIRATHIIQCSKQRVARKKKPVKRSKDTEQTADVGVTCAPRI